MKVMNLGKKTLRKCAWTDLGRSQDVSQNWQRCDCRPQTSCQHYYIAVACLSAELASPKVGGRRRRGAWRALTQEQFAKLQLLDLAQCDSAHIHNSLGTIAEV
jgi:hypothetical protein